jgi:hypothetical protein
MPNRPPKTKRPHWNTELDYHERERERLELVAEIRAHATRYLETDHLCPGCDTRIWEADADGTLYRGCHCRTFTTPPGHPLGGTPPDLTAWKKAAYQGNAIMELGYRQRVEPQPTNQTPMPTERKFGPFLIPADAHDQIKPAGFACFDCHHPVERLAMVVPAMVPRMVFYVCKCGTVQVWEDEKQPSGSVHWRENMELLRSANVELLAFNGNKPLQTNFSGSN